MLLQKNVCISAILLMLSVVPMTASVAQIQDNQHTTDSADVKGKNIIGKIIDYFEDSNDSTEEGKLDYSFIGGPSYSNSTSVSLGMLGACLYKTAMGDSVTLRSDASIYGNVSVTGFYSVGIRGTHFQPKNTLRVIYDCFFESYPTYFWGIGYANDSVDDNKTEYLQLTVDLSASAEWKISENFYIGPALRINHTKGKDIEVNLELWQGEPLTVTSYGLGLNVSYDSRDLVSNAYRGWYIGLKQQFYPRFIGNDMCFSSTEFALNHYFPVWKGGILAAQLHGLFTYGNTPWNMLATLGGSYSMRGYYRGRYRDKNAVDFTLELRQHIWRRNSAVVWIGAGTVFSRNPREMASANSSFSGKRILPNVGIGYRWEFKERVNIRVDVGYGKHGAGFVFNINEAF